MGTPVRIKDFKIKKIKKIKKKINTLIVYKYILIWASLVAQG